MRSRIMIQSPVAILHGVGPAAAKRLKQLGIETVEQLLWHIPFRYEDYRTMARIADLQIGQTATVEGVVELIANRRSFRRRMMITEALVRDNSGSIKIVWFNQPYLAQNIRPNDRVLLSGKVSDQNGNLQLVSPAYEKRGVRDAIHTGRLVPIYTTTKGLTERQLRYFVSQVHELATFIPDPLPQTLITKEGLPTIGDALSIIHFPKNERERDRALERLKFDELLVFQLSRQMEERRAAPMRARPLPFAERETKRFLASLPFQLTNGQRRAAWDIVQDMSVGKPMNRLLEGDVGSGKTVVAAIAILNALTAGVSVALLAPTEILAQQHFATFRDWFRNMPWTVAVRTSAFRAVATRGAQHPHRRLRPSVSRLTIGTHALLEDGVDLGNVGLVIVDEQHRFGVAQRSALRSRGLGRTPHFLSLTATPIPRSLALSLAGDLKLSTLRTLPKGRKPIDSKLLGPHERDLAYRFAEKTMESGRQVFCIAPLIEPSDALGIASATSLFEEVRSRFPHRRIGLLHGKLPSVQKNDVLRAFARHELDALVATPVVEVGIDVPNATVLICEGAERFGLAQLHQLRGRIGRGEHRSTCFFLARTETPLARRRLAAVASTTDGFRLAELDLELRGPGDLAGTLQSGFLDFRFATLGDHALMLRARAMAETILDRDPNLARHQPLKHLLFRPSNHRE